MSVYGAIRIRRCSDGVPCRDAGQVTRRHTLVSVSLMIVFDTMQLEMFKMTSDFHKHFVALLLYKTTFSLFI